MECGMDSCIHRKWKYVLWPDAEITTEVTLSSKYRNAISQAVWEEPIRPRKLGMGVPLILGLLERRCQKLRVPIFFPVQNPSIQVVLEWKIRSVHVKSYLNEELSQYCNSIMHLLYYSPLRHRLWFCHHVIASWLLISACWVWVHDCESDWKWVV